MSGQIIGFPLCPHCGQHDVAFYYVHSYYRNEYTYMLLMCGHCQSPVVAAFRGPLLEGRRIKFSDISGYFPHPDRDKAPEYTPEPVAKDFEEAKFNLIHGKYKSACIMAGSSIETACVQFGAVDGGLKGKIRKLHDDGIITQSLADWAQELREIRVDAAHQAERESVITKEDAEQAVYFAEMLFTYLYKLPKMIEERRKKS
ncbi:MAG: DUF4145 domain-containing protein [Desulfovibrio sp.]|uniref:DUF4145 domain-containing protein n=1 Tax=Desulfovibrio sp. TaxID=885 RepID=UPI001A651350|nr:DUF4145 domain-containing protein [Desulfovibrio sp.]MBD5417341.1 DUF4145 domain-containing protein [Desulfovibrio sp.]